MNNGIKITRNYANPFEGLKLSAQHSPLYNEKDFELMTTRSSMELTNYLDMISKYDKLDLDYLDETYRYNKLDVDNRMLALYTELYADKTEKKDRKIITGYDAQGKEVTEIKNFSDYEYNKYLLEQDAKYIKEQELLDFKQSQKSFWKNIIPTSTQLVGDFALGFVKTFEDFFNLVDAIATADYDNWSSFLESFRASMSDERIGTLDMSWLRNIEENFEQYKRDTSLLVSTSGERNTIGRVLEGVATTMGQILAAYVGTMGAANIGSLLNTPISAMSNTARSLVHATFYYGSMSSGTLKETFKDPKYASTSTASILANEGIKLAVEIGIELIVDKLGGKYAKDMLERGVVSKGATETIPKRLAKAVFQEGFEEGLQEFSGWAINNITSYVTNNNVFYEEFDFQTIADAAVIGAVTSGLSETGQIFTEKANKSKVSKKLVKSNKLLERQYEQITDKKQKREFRYNVYDIFSNYQNAINELDVDKKYEAVMQMYTSYDILANTFGAMGEARVKKANILLEKLSTEYVKPDTHVPTFMSQANTFVDELVKDVGVLAAVGTIKNETSEKVKKSLIEVFNKDKRTDKEKGVHVVATSLNGKIIDNDNAITENGKNTLESLEKDGYDFVIIDNFKYVVEKNGVFFANISNVNNMSKEELTKAATEDDFVNTLISEMDKSLFEEIRNLYNKLYSKNTDDDVTMMYKIIYDASTFDMLLRHSDKTIFAFMSKLTDIITVISKRDVKTSMDKEYLGTLKRVRQSTYASIIMYCCNNPDADFQNLTFLSEQQLTFIFNHRYGFDIAERIKKGTYTEQDENVLKNRINAAPFTSSNVKKDIENRLFSNNPSSRIAALKQLDELYDNTYYGKYNDVVYMSGTDVNSCWFNEYCKLNNLDVRYIKGTKTSVELKEAVVAKFGTYNRTNKLRFIKEQFEYFTNDNLTLEYTIDGNNVSVKVVEKSPREYNYKQTETGKLHTGLYPVLRADNIVLQNINSLLSDKLSDIDLQYITVNDIATYPTKYLSPETLNTIKKEYGVVNKETTYVYLREQLAENNIALTLDERGNVKTTRYEYIDNFVKEDINPDDFLVNNEYNISAFILDKALPDRAKDIRVIFDDKRRNAAYDASKNIIYLPKVSTKSSLRTSIMHEYYHALSKLLNLGSGYNMDNRLTADVIKDIEAHVPSLFTADMNSKQKANVAKRFIYGKTSDEIRAYSVDQATNEYPIIVNAKNKTITMPWGTKYNLKGDAISRMYYSKSDATYDDAKLVASESKNIILDTSGKEHSVFDDNNYKSYNKYLKKPETITPSEQSTFEVEQNEEVEQKEITKDEYDKATDYINAINKALAIVSQNKDVKKSLDKLNLSDSVKQKLLTHKYSKTKDGDYKEAMSIKRSYESRQRSKQRDILREKSRRERIETNKAADKTTNYVTISKKDAGDTNLKYYTGGIYPRKVTRGTYNFIKASTDNLDKLPEVLANAIVKGMLTQDTVYDYIRTAKSIDNFTFSLIKKCFFPTSPFNTFKDVQSFVNNSLIQAYAFSVAMYKLGVEDAVPEFDYDDFVEVKNKDGSISKILRVVYNVLTVPEFKKLYDKAINDFGKGYVLQKDGKVTYEQLNVDYSQLTLTALKQFDGTFNKVQYIVNIGDYIAKRGYNARYAGKKRSTSFDATIGDLEDGATMLDLLGDNETANDSVTEEQKRTYIQEHFANVLYDFVNSTNETGKPNRKKLYKLLSVVYEKFNKMSKEEQLNFAIKQLRHFYDIETGNFKKKELAKFIGNYNNFIDNLEERQVIKLFTRLDLGQDLGISSEIMLKQDVEKLDVNIKKTKDKVRNYMYRNIAYITPAVYKYMPEEYKKFFVQVGKKIKFDTTILEHKNSTEINKLYEEIKECVRFAKEGYFANKQAKQLFDKLEKARRDRLKALANSKTNISKTGQITYSVEVPNKEFTIQSNTDMPAILKTILDTTFSKTANSTTKYLTSENEKHMKISAKTFYEMNADALQNITVAEAEAIVNYFNSAVCLPGNVDDTSLIKFETYKMMLFTYFIKASRNGTLELSVETVASMETQIELMTRKAGTILSLWRTVLDQLAPEEIIANMILQELGVEINEDDLKPLIAAVSSGDVTKIDASIEELKNKLAIEYGKNTKKVDKIFNALLVLHRTAMLSGPNTIVRAHTSNIAITAINKLADFLGNILLKKNKKLKSLPDQYNFDDVEVSEDTKNWIMDNLINNGYFKLISDGLLRVDTRTTKRSSKAETDIAMYIVKQAVNQIKNDVKGFNKFIGLVNWAQSDDYYIRTAFVEYLGKLLTIEKIDLSSGVSSKEVLALISKAYGLASYDYVHRPNFVQHLESTLYKKYPKIYRGYKLILPFLSSTVNWFGELFDLTPIGLATNIVKLCKIEQTINKLEDAKALGEVIPYDPTFVSMIASRKIGKGVIGSILTIIGIILGATGIMEIDDDDDKLKLRVFDYYVDISNEYAAMSVILGAQLTNPKDGNFIDVLKDCSDTILEEFILTTFIDTFRNYGDGTTDYISSVGMNLIGSFVPNLLKSVVKMVNYKKISYSSGFMGNLEYLAYSTIPGSYNWFDIQIDPFTGEEQLRYGTKGFLNILNGVTSSKITKYKMSRQEEIATLVGYSPSQLKGQYKDIGNVDKTMLNKKYGELNNRFMTDFINNKTKHLVEVSKGKYKELYFKDMSNEQKNSVLKSIANKNAEYAKIYTWTNSGHKYYCSWEKRKELVKLGISKNVYIGNKGFVK